MSQDIQVSIPKKPSATMCTFKYTSLPEIRLLGSIVVFLKGSRNLNNYISTKDLKPGDMARSMFHGPVNMMVGDILNLTVENVMQVEFAPAETMVIYGVWFYRSDKRKLYFMLDEDGPGMAVSYRDRLLYPVPELSTTDAPPRITQVREVDEVLQLCTLAGL